MPIKFTATELPIKTEFDFEGYLVNIHKHIKPLFFSDQWVGFWNQNLKHYDLELHNQVDAGYSPVAARRAETGITRDYEVYSFEYLTDHGVYNYQFDIESVKSMVESYPIEAIKLGEVYVDPETEYIAEKLNHDELPIFVRFYGVSQPFVCIDGNKRLMARIHNGQEEFKAHIIYENQLNGIFFTTLDLLFYLLHAELEYLFRGVNLGKDPYELYKATRLYHALNN